MSFVGELGWELHAPLDQIAALYDALFEAGAAHGLTDLGGYAFNGMRMEKAFRASGELATDVGPYDVGLDRFVRVLGRNYIGRDALLARDAEWELLYAEGIDIHGGDPVLLDGAPVGLTTSGGFGYTIGKSLGWLFVRKGTPHQGLSAQILNQAHPVTVHDAPLVDPDNLRPRMES